MIVSPPQAWSRFTHELKDFRSPDHRTQALQCLNLLITNALQHAVDVLQYMSRIQNQSVFNFCAIPQVTDCYNFENAKDFNIAMKSSCSSSTSNCKDT